MSEIKFQRLDSKNKKKWIALAVVVLIMAGVIFYITGRTHSAGSDEVLGNKMVDGLSFENATLVYKDGITTLTVEVYNESGNTYNLKTIDVKVTDENDEEVVLSGYIGNTIETDEGKVLKTSIDKDLSKAKKITYEIKKEE